MRFKLDENLPAALRWRLSAAGHEVDTAAEEGLSGATDEVLYSNCQLAQRVLLTLDLDFSDIRVYPPGTGKGIVVLRPERQDLASLSRLIEQLVTYLAAESPEGGLWIVEERRLRIRE